MNSHWREKPRILVKLQLPVPKTDTGGHAEKAKGSERTSAKELGKMTP